MHVFRHLSCTGMRLASDNPMPPTPPPQANDDRQHNKAIIFSSTGHARHPSHLAAHAQVAAGDATLPCARPHGRPAGPFSSPRSSHSASCWRLQRPHLLAGRCAARRHLLHRCAYHAPGAVRTAWKRLEPCMWGVGYITGCCNWAGRVLRLAREALGTLRQGQCSPDTSSTCAADVTLGLSWVRPRADLHILHSSQRQGTQAVTCHGPVYSRSTTTHHSLPLGASQQWGSHACLLPVSFLGHIHPRSPSQTLARADPAGESKNHPTNIVDT